MVLGSFFSPSGPIFSPEYNRFAASWDVVRLPFGSEHHWYWSGKRQEWENYDPVHYLVSDIGLEVLKDDLNEPAWEIWAPLELSWAQVRGQQPDAIWSPHNGGWFIWRNLSQPLPSPTSPPKSPEWEKRMNEELAAAERLGSLSPAEREQIRQTILKRYFG